jgi:hypothetical protein
MTHEAFCEKHGPYDANPGGCPYCARQSSGPPQPPPLLDDEEPTDPWGGRGRPDYFDDDLEETDPRVGRRDFEDDLEETDLPRRMRRGDAWDDLDKTVVDRPAKTGLLGWLIVKEGTRRGKIYEIQDGTAIGRKDGNVLLNDVKVSKLHAKIRVKDDQFEIGDMFSENGTFVNGEQIQGPTPLQENDEIKMGDTVFVLKTLE